MKIRSLKLVDKIAGSVLARLLSARSPSRTCCPNHFLIIRPGGIGDAVLLAPAIQAIKRRFPAAEITILAEKRNHAAFLLCPAIDRMLCYDKPKELIQALRNKYDIVIDTEQWHRLSAVVARLAKASISVGCGTNERKQLFSHPVYYSHDDYEVGSFFNMLAPVGISAPSQIALPFLWVPDKDAEMVGKLLAPLSEKRFVTIFTGASIPERRWGVDRFRTVTKRLHALGIPVVLVGGKDDADEGERIIAEKYGLNLAGKTSLAETAAVIDKAAVLLSGDSGILHIGVGLGKPTISLFGPGIAKKWAPRGDRHIVLNKHLPCSPCTKFGYTPKCLINAKCMSDITVDEVVDAVLHLLEKTGNLPK